MFTCILYVYGVVELNLDNILSVPEDDGQPMALQDDPIAVSKVTDGKLDFVEGVVATSGIMFFPSLQPVVTNMGNGGA